MAIFRTPLTHNIDYRTEDIIVNMTTLASYWFVGTFSIRSQTCTKMRPRRKGYGRVTLPLFT